MAGALRFLFAWAGIGLCAALACARPVEPGPPAAPPVTSAPPEPVGVDPSLLTTSELAPGDVEAKCLSPLYLPRCLQARAHPEVRFTWSLSWDEYRTNERGDQVAYTESEMLTRRQQVIDRALADGVREIYPRRSRLSEVILVGPAPAVRGAMALPHVRMVTVNCADDDREFCACERLRVDQCAAHAFCQEVHGLPRCREPAALAGCTRAELCPTVIAHAYDPKGVLWQFSSGCLPAQPGWQPVAWTEATPPCEGAVEPR
ncbi:hypothetical protein [Nannocystis radixulma]|uniref:Lipoprotein n=1 Tax=Nannocystis radixulma TaxID=2995305 RepID=A0ABT5B9W4_9BACT|nr:hypothetical protein [Nannocystis radixulma]MDC0670405.1 hypothetical protein [Nannocystis radixulma]